jgi:hypothetical protein
MNVEIGTEAAQFQEKEYIKGIFVAVQVFSEGNQCFDDTMLMIIRDNTVRIISVMMTDETKKRVYGDSYFGESW